MILILSEKNKMFLMASENKGLLFCKKLATSETLYKLIKNF